MKLKSFFFSIAGAIALLGFSLPSRAWPPANIPTTSYVSFIGAHGTSYISHKGDDGTRETGPQVLRGYISPANALVRAWGMSGRTDWDVTANMPAGSTALPKAKSPFQDGEKFSYPGAMVQYQYSRGQTVYWDGTKRVSGQKALVITGYFDCLYKYQQGCVEKTIAAVQAVIDRAKADGVEKIVVWRMGDVNQDVDISYVIANDQALYGRDISIDPNLWTAMQMAWNDAFEQYLWDPYAAARAGLTLIPGKTWPEMYTLDGVRFKPNSQVFIAQQLFAYITQ